MEFFKQQTHINFLGLRKKAAILSCVLCLLSVLALLVNGLRWGLDFTGGTQLQFSFPGAANVSHLRQRLQAASFAEVIVQTYGNSRDVLLSLAPQHQAKQQQIATQIRRALPEATLKRVEFVGPQVGQELVTQGILAVFVALLGIMFYVGFRFERRFAVGAAVALIHDPILILGVFALLRIEFNLTALAAILAVIGYSLNDMVVIFDRIRDNFHKFRRSSPVEVVNLSINQTLSRTIMTSLTTLVIVLSLLFFAGPLIRSFAIALIIGIVVGTYSSIYIAGALAVALGLTHRHLPSSPKRLFKESEL